MIIHISYHTIKLLIILLEIEVIINKPYPCFEGQFLQDRLFYVSKINKVSTISVFHCCFFYLCHSHEYLTIIMLAAVNCVSRISCGIFVPNISEQFKGFARHIITLSLCL